MIPGDERSLHAVMLALREITPQPELRVMRTGGPEGGTLGRARACREELGGRGVIVIRDRTAAEGEVLSFLAETPAARAYPLTHDLLVVEVGVPSLLRDPRVRSEVPRGVWRVASHLNGVRLGLWLAPFLRRTEWVIARALLVLAAPRRSRARQGDPAPPAAATFAIHTFVSDESLYRRMRASFLAAGFPEGSFVRLSDSDDDPYAAINRLARRPPARYPILCHQDVLADQGAACDDLLARLRELDVADPSWAVAGNAGYTRTGRLIRQLEDPAGGPSGDRLPRAVVTLDENFLVFNGRRMPLCSPNLGGFHLYAADACLNALQDGDSAYVIDFPLTHLSPGSQESAEYARARERFATAWSVHSRFRYVVTPSGVIFLSRYKPLRALFGSRPATAWLGHGLHDALFRRPSGGRRARPRRSSR